MRSRPTTRPRPWYHNRTQCGSEGPTTVSGCSGSPALFEASGEGAVVQRPFELPLSARLRSSDNAGTPRAWTRQGPQEGRGPGRVRPTPASEAFSKGPHARLLKTRQDKGKTRHGNVKAGQDKTRQKSDKTRTKTGKTRQEPRQARQDKNQDRQ